MARAPRPKPVIMAHPPGAIQAGIAVAHDAIGSLGAQPVLLLLVIINSVFIIAGAFFLWRLEDTRAQSVLAILDIVKMCVAR